MVKQAFVHDHEQGAVNVPVNKSEIRFCNENVKPGQGWYFQTSPYLSREQRRRIQNTPAYPVPNQRKITRGRMLYRLVKTGVAFAKKMVNLLTTGENKPFLGKTMLSRIIQNALRRPKLAY